MPATAMPGTRCSPRSSRTPTSPSACSAPSCGRATARRSARRPCAGSAAQGAREFAGRLLVSARDWLETTFASERAHGLLAPWVLHTGLGPDAAASGYMAQVIAVAVQEGGMPIPRGGGAKLADALVALIRARGGTCETGVQVERCLRRRRSHVRRAARRSTAARAVDLQRDADAALRRAARAAKDAGAERFRYGRSEMQIHFALSEPPQWEGDERLGGTAIVHLTPGLDGVSRAVNEAERGLLPAEATVVVGQPLTMDASRAPEGKGILWSSCRSCRGRSRATRRESSTSATARGARAARALRRPHPGAARAAHPEPRVVDPRSASSLSPADLQAANVNLVHGDPYGGSLALDQNFLWRPLPRSPAPHAGGRRLARRRVHPPGPGSRRRQRRPRRAAAARTAAHEARGQPPARLGLESRL